MAAASVEIHDEVSVPSGGGSGWRLCFQRVTYHYHDGDPDQDGYRFIWRRPNGNLQAARGQARIPSASKLKQLIRAASTQGWLR